jgi:hypothetical protein
VKTFGPKQKTPEYGLNVLYTDNKWRKYWYGSNRSLRDRRHNEYHRRHDVKVVQDIQK